jgi:hypothetical protein
MHTCIHTYKNACIHGHIHIHVSVNSPRQACLIREHRCLVCTQLMHWTLAPPSHENLNHPIPVMHSCWYEHTWVVCRCLYDWCAELSRRFSWKPKSPNTCDVFTWVVWRYLLSSVKVFVWLLCYTLSHENLNHTIHVRFSCWFEHTWVVCRCLYDWCAELSRSLLIKLQRTQQLSCIHACFCFCVCMCACVCMCVCVCACVRACVWIGRPWSHTHTLSHW